MGTGFGWDIVQHSRLLHAGAAWLLALCLPWALDVIQEGLAGTGTLGKRDPFPWQAENSNMWRQLSLCIFRSFPSLLTLLEVLLQSCFISWLRGASRPPLLCHETLCIGPRRWATYPTCHQNPPRHGRRSQAGEMLTSQEEQWAYYTSFFMFLENSGTAAGPNWTTAFAPAERTSFSFTKLAQAGNWAWNMPFLWNK